MVLSDGTSGPVVFPGLQGKSNLKTLCARTMDFEFVGSEDELALNLRRIRKVLVIIAYLRAVGVLLIMLAIKIYIRLIVPDVA